MCQARIYLRQNGNENLIMEDVALVESKGGICTLSTLFGEEKRVRGRIARIDLLKHAVYLEEVQDVQGMRLWRKDGSDLPGVRPADGTDQ